MNAISASLATFTGKSDPSVSSPDKRKGASGSAQLFHRMVADALFLSDLMERHLCAGYPETSATTSGGT